MQLNQRKVGAILSYVSIIVLTLITLVYTPIMLRYLGDAEYGVYNLTVSIVSYLSLLSLGFGGAYVRFFYQFKVKKQIEEIRKLNGLFMIVYMLMGLVSLIAGAIIIKNLDFILRGKMTHEEINLSKRLMVVLVINIFLTFPATVFDAYITANERFIFQRFNLLLRQVLSPLLGLPLLMMGYRSLALVIVTTLVTLGSLLLSMYFAIVKLKMEFHYKDLDFKLLKDIAVFSSFLFLNMITDQINWSIDKFVLGKLVGSVGITIYAMGSLINDMYLKVSSSISSVFIPHVNDMVQRGTDDEEISKFFTKIGRIQFYMLILILFGFFTFGPYFISEIWLDPSYMESYYVALILLVPVTIPLVQNIGIEIQRAKNMHKFRSVVYFFIAIANLFISVPLAKSYGPIGSAIGTAISVFIGNGIIMNIYYKKRVGINIGDFWKNILSVSKGFIIPLIFTALIRKRGISSNLDFVVYVVLYTLVYLGSTYFLSMNTYEKDLFFKPLRKLFGKRR